MEKDTFPDFPVVNIKDQVEWMFCQPYFMSSMVFHDIPHGWPSRGEYWSCSLWKDFLHENVGVMFPVFCVFYVDGFSLLRNAGTGKTAGLYFLLGNLPISVSCKVENKLLLSLIPLYGKDRSGKKRDMDDLFNVLRFQLNVMNSEVSMYHACLQKNVPVSLRFKLFLGDGQERSFLGCIQGSGADFFCNRCIVSKEVQPKVTIRGHKSRKDVPDGSKKVLPGNNTIGANRRRLEEAICLENPTHGYLPERVALNPLFNKPVMLVHHFDPYVHIPSDIGHDALLGICRKEVFSTFKSLNLASKGTFMTRLNMLCGSKKKKGSFSLLGGRRKVHPTGAVNEGSWLRNMTADESLTMVAIAPILFRGLAPGELVYALDIHARIVKMQFAWELSPPEVGKLKNLILEHDRLLSNGPNWINFCGTNKLHTRRFHHIEDINLLGSLRLANTMGFEAKHQAFKRIADRGQSQDTSGHSSKRMLTGQTLRNMYLQDRYVAPKCFSVQTPCFTERFFPRDQEKQNDAIRNALNLTCTHFRVSFFSQANINFVQFDVENIVKLLGEVKFFDVLVFFSLNFSCDECELQVNDMFSVLKPLPLKTGRRWTVELSRSNQSHTPKVPLELFQVILQTDPAYAILNIKDCRFEKVLLTKVFKENSPSFLDGFTISTSMVLE
jgi:hypothetical protein